MQEPSSSKFPNGYDDDTTLFGPMTNGVILSVKTAIGVDELAVQVREDASVLTPPLYLTFEGGEIWYVGPGGLTNNNGVWTFTLVTHASQRAMHDSPLQPHMVKEKIFINIMERNMTMLKRVLQATQKYHFLIGTETARQAKSPEAGERWLCIDSKKIYFCFVAGTWTWVNRVRHQDLINLAANDHPQYLLSAGVTSFHTGLSGAHILAGDDHDHTTANEGAAVSNIRGGLLAARGTPVTQGDMYFATDDENGNLYIAADGVNWEKVSGIPSGAIAMFAGACPAGWTRYVALDTRFPYGASSDGAVGGVTSHGHAYSEIVQHYHVLNSKTVTLSSAGSHSHTVITKETAGGVSGISVFGGNTTWDTSSVGDHKHAVSTPARLTGSTGSTPLSTSTDSTLPPYKEVVFCKKN